MDTVLVLNADLGRCTGSPSDTRFGCSAATSQRSTNRSPTYSSASGRCRRSSDSSATSSRSGGTRAAPLGHVQACSHVTDVAAPTAAARRRRSTTSCPARAAAGTRGRTRSPRAIDATSARDTEHPTSGVTHCGSFRRPHRGRLSRRAEPDRVRALGARRKQRSGVRWPGPHWGLV